jgi:Zn-dependent M28 family amino/carboxypeptidase
VAYLASPALAGRAAGSAGGDSAAAFIARHYEHLGLHGVFPAACQSVPACPPSFFQFFGVEGATAQNVAVVVPGADSAVRGEYIVVGAHYDHLGRSARGARDAELGAVIRPGADDNASGTAAVLELGRRLAARPSRRSVLLVHFDAEELGLVGSHVFVEHAPVGRGSMVFMVNLDMVGRLRGKPLTLHASAMPRQMRALVDSVVAAAGVRASYSSATADRSDHASFGAAGVPALALFTGFHSDYHKVSDVVARLDVPGILRVVDVAEGLVRAVADRAGSSVREQRAASGSQPSTP